MALSKKKKVGLPEILKSIKAAADLIIEQGFIVSVPTVYNKSKDDPLFPAKQKCGGYIKSQIEAYANATWENPSRAKTATQQAEATKPGTSPHALDSKARILAADAAMREHKLGVAQGQYYLKSAEDQRDALILYGVKSGVLNGGPFIIRDLISMAGAELGPDAAAALGRISPELRARYTDSALDLFDSMAKRGGIETPDCDACRRANHGELPGALAISENE